MKNFMLAIIAGLLGSSAVALVWLSEKTERARMEAELEAWEAGEQEWLNQLFEDRRREAGAQLRSQEV